MATDPSSYGVTAMSARVILVSLTCSSTRHPGVGRFVWHEHSWVLHGVSRQRPGCTLPSSDGETLSGSFQIPEDYPGCPSCRADNFVRCHMCANLGCWDSSWELFMCPTCGRSGPVSGYIDSISSLGSS